MNPRQINRLILMALWALAQGAPSLAATLPDHWINEQEKSIYFAPRPELQTKLTRLEADDDYWDQLEVDLVYSGNAMRAQIQALQAAYPGYKANRIVLSRETDHEITIPSLNLKVLVPTLPGQEGPYFQYTTFVSRSQSKKVETAYKAPDFVQIQGSVRAYVPEIKTVERIEIGSEVCDELVGGESSVFSLMKAYQLVLNRVDALSMKYPGTRDSLKRSVLDSCIELIEGNRIDNFSSLMSLQVTKRSGGRRPFGETRRVVSEPKSIPLTVDVVRLEDSRD
jgi:hypothetical protein